MPRESLHLHANQWHGERVTEPRACRRQLGQSQAKLAAMLGVALNSLRMWDSGMRTTPTAVLEQAKTAAAEAVRDRQPLTLPQLATELHVHVRTLQAAARTGRLEVQYSTRSIFGPTAQNLNPRRRKTISANVLQAIQRATCWTLHLAARRSPGLRPPNPSFAARPATLTGGAARTV